MSYKRNVLMVADGLLPVSEVAEAVSKAPSTLHRLANKGDVAHDRNGSALYIDLGSLARYFDQKRNEHLAKVVRALLVTTQAEAKAELAGSLDTPAPIEQQPQQVPKREPLRVPVRKRNAT